MLDFECKRCRNLILVEIENIGDLVKCPNCESAEIVPDIPLQAGYELSGYVIDGIAESNQLWTCYRAKKTDDPSTIILLKIPTSFFLKHLTDCDAFINSVVRNGSLNVPEFPKLIDRSVVRGEMFFAYDYVPETHNISFFSKIDFMDSLRIIRNIAVTFKNAWDKNYLLHLDLTPDNIRLTKDKAVRIQNMGISGSLLKDQNLLDWGFNIWDRRYMSPEFIQDGIADSPSCDIYSLGGILFLMITGHHPFESVNPVDIYKVPIPEPLQYNQHIPPRIVALYHGMMAKSMDDRINSWDLVVEDLNSILGLDVVSGAQTQFVARYEKTDSTPSSQQESEHFARGEKKKKVFYKKKEKPHKRLVFNSESTLKKLSTVHSKWKK